MAEQDIAEQWRSFSPERREQLLGKMTADQKRILRQNIEGGRRAADFTANPKGEGLYQMQPAAGSVGFVGIPYSNVLKASGAGYKIHPADREQYARDRRAEILQQQPRLSEPEYLQQMQLPEAAPEKPSLWSRVESGVQRVTEPTTSATGPAPAAGEMGLNVIKRVGRVLFGVPDFGAQAWSAVRDMMSSDPQKSMEGERRLQEMHPGAQIVSRARELRSDYQRDPKLAAANVAGDVAGLWLTQKAMELPGKVVSKAATYTPRTVPLAGEEIPVPSGEAEPRTPAGRRQLALKRSGVGGEHFEKLAAVQQARVKAVLRNTAQQTSGLIGPMNDEPGLAMKDAAERTFAKARPLYNTVDQALRTVPADFSNVSAVVKSAIQKARRMGVVIDPEAANVATIRPEADGTIQWGGTRISKATHPERWAELIDQGIIDDSGTGTPLTAYTGIRSQLLKMQRAALDPAVRNAIGDEVSVMNSNIEAAMKGTSLFADWQAANKLWAKGYALRRVADAISGVTKGTPEAAQAKQVAGVPTRVQGASLVAKLNKLAKEGHLAKAFSPREIENLRQSADLLDRSQRTPIGQGRGESLSRSHGLRKALTGSAGPVIGAGAGAVIGGLTHGPFGMLEGAAGGAGAAAVVQAIGDRALAKLMTTTEGVEALRTLSAAKTVAQREVALKALATAAASAAQPAPATLQQLRGEAAQRNPHRSPSGTSTLIRPEQP